MAGWGYDVIGALDATPGTEELRTIAARVERVDTGALADLARRYASLAEGLDTSVRAVATRGDGVGRAWQGPGADAFARYTADFARAGSGTGEAARHVQGELAGLGRTLAAVREEVAGHVSDALDLARARPAEVRAAVATPTARARAAVDRAEQEVAECARRLRGIADGFTGFSRLRSPDAGVMSASSGATSRWTDRRGAVIGADDPVQAARILDGGSGGSGSGGSGSDGGLGSGGDAGSGTGHDGAGPADSSDADRGSSDGDHCSRADAADPGNAGRYDTGSDGTGGAESGGGVHSGVQGSGGASDQDRSGADPGQDDADEDGKAEDGKADSNTDEGKADGKDAGQPTGTAASSGRGGVEDWIRQATAILAENGVDADTMKPEDIATIIEHESGGDPDAVNNWDSNADKGTPSKGLMQTIGPTFEANKLPGHDDITDPVDNIIAAVRYAIRRYGSVSEVPGVEAVARGEDYVGY
ncbi:transglycosylase SLT domain-containing protein [Actinomycetospora chiangmaiensis]|uniref:transglycosylase SLT domain-containing protein n=1 Tax=Actinomycetospora chiangmaiensis TaxID=402650 RepID=UPI00037AED5E|nr:transglycosylase SLT domain-containing protein [Actinomycetospora chiangmaiensis]